MIRQRPLHDEEAGESALIHNELALLKRKLKEKRQGVKLYSRPLTTLYYLVQVIKKSIVRFVFVSVPFLPLTSTYALRFKTSDGVMMLTNC